MTGPAEELAEHEHCDRAVDKLMGRDGDPLLATGTRAMWISLLKSERAAVRGDVARWIARLKRLEHRIECAQQVLGGGIPDSNLLTVAAASVIESWDTSDGGPSFMENMSADIEALRGVLLTLLRLSVKTTTEKQP